MLRYEHFENNSTALVKPSKCLNLHLSCILSHLSGFEVPEENGVDALLGWMCCLAWQNLLAFFTGFVGKELAWG